MATSPPRLPGAPGKPGGVGVAKPPGGANMPHHRRMLTNTQRGTAGEQLLAACVIISSAGDLELFKPLTDDDHTDVTAGKRGKVPALAIQVKTALTLNRQGYAVAKMVFPSGKPRVHESFVYAIVYVTAASVDAAWVVPSAAFSRLAYRGPGPKGRGIELEFMASPTRHDRWSKFRCGRMDVGPKLIALIDSLPAGLTVQAKLPAGVHLLLRARPRPMRVR